MHFLVAAILAAILSTGSVAGSGSASGAGSVARGGAVASAGVIVGAGSVVSGGSMYREPLATARVLTLFRPPAEKYGAGHLGVDLAAPPGASVLAAGAGVVRFAGPVAGRGVVVLVHPDGISTEYEPVAAVVVAGQRVTASERIGTVRGAHRSCAAVSCLHWGARRGDAYLDPLSLLRPLGVVRLLPWD
jgi:murein DD-endopeptidase MepM/ murein hydrolase activator NlpD